MQLKKEFASYDALRREHDTQIVSIAAEAGLRISPDQWSSLLYGDTSKKAQMQSIIDKVCRLQGNTSHCQANQAEKQTDSLFLTLFVPTLSSHSRYFLFLFFFCCRCSAAITAFLQPVSAGAADRIGKVRGPGWSLTPEAAL
jgi:hypothetical protein